MNPPHDVGRARAPRGPLNWLVVAAFVVVALAVGVFAWWRQAEAVRLSNVRREANAKVLAEEMAKNEAQAKPPSETPKDDSVATNRRKELADIANAGTLIGIKRDQAQELVRKVAAYREEKDGFEQHLAAFDAAFEKLKAVADPKTSAEIKTTTTSATEAVDTMSLELKWLTDNRKGRDEAKRIEAEIVSSLDAELVRFKASEVAAFAFNDGTKLRQRGKSALAKGDFVAAGKDLSAAKAKLSAALLDAKAFFVSLAVSAAKQRKAAEQWEQCVAEAEKALAIDSTNAEAKALKDEANGHLVPTMRLDKRGNTTDLGGVQLWKDGPYWAECNVGASKPEEAGYYFWWGDTVGYKHVNDSWQAVDGSRKKFSFSESNCPTSGKGISQLRAAGYVDASGNLVAAHDAATAHLGAPWRMPTKEEFDALSDNCTTEWTTRNGVDGRLVTGKGDFSSKSIFLPAAGRGCGSSLYDAGSYGNYWSSTPYSDSSYNAWRLYFNSSYFYRYYYYRYYGQSVRPLRGFAE